MKSVLLLTICIFLVVEGLGSLKKATSTNKPLRAQPLVAGKNVDHVIEARKNLQEKRRSSRADEILYQPQLVAASTDAAYFWAEDREYVFGIQESAGVVPIVPGGDILKSDAVVQTDASVYEFRVLFDTEAENLLPSNDYGITDLFIGISYFESSGGTVVQLDLPFSAEILSVTAHIFKGENYAGFVEGAGELNDEGTKLVGAVGGVVLGGNSGVTGIMLIIEVLNLDDSNTDDTDETFQTGENSNVETVTDLPTETLDTDLTEDTTEETKQTQQTTDATEETQETSESQATSASQATSEPSGSQPDTTVSGSNTEEDTNTAPTEATKTSQTQAPTSAPTSAATSDETSGAATLCAGFLAIASALVQLM